MGRILTTRTAHALAWGVSGTSVALAVVGLALAVPQWSTPLPEGVDEQAVNTAFLISFVPFSLVGALILYRRPENRIGWIFCAMGLAVLLGSAASEYAVYGLITRPGSLPGSDIMAWLAEWVVFAGLFGALLLPLVFPDGHLLSRRWFPLAGLGVLGGLMLGLGAAFAPGPLSITSAKNPFGIDALSFLSEESNPGWIAFLVLPFAGIAAITIRFRRSQGDDRRRMRLFAYSLGLLAVALALLNFSSEDTQPPLWVLFVLAATFAFVPTAAGLAILRHNLFDIELVISRALVYGVLVAFLTAAYVVIVVGVGALVGSSGNLVLGLLATAVIAVAFQPLRDRARRVVDRVVYGQRATPYEVLAEFSERMGEIYATEDIVPRMVRILGEGTAATRAEVWLRTGSSLRLAATWPEQGVLEDRAIPLPVDRLPEFPSVSAAASVRHHGELLGALTVTKPPNETLTPVEERLVADLAAQAGLVLRNVALIADLRASRQRLVAAQDEARRRLERNLHDGAQQQLVALAVKQRLAEGLVRRDPDKAAAILAELQAETAEALENLRDLARGIYPPLLAEKGLEAALVAQARKSPFRVTVEAHAIGRYRQEIEAAVYFCSLEALQNVAKYAAASTATLRLIDDEGWLMFVVTDDGVGFDAATTSRGMGLQGMADRLEALGGALEIRSGAGDGTTVIGRIPSNPATSKSTAP